MANSPYHPTADPKLQMTGFPTMDWRNLEAMVRYIRAMQNLDVPEDRYELYSDDVVLDDWMEPGDLVVGKEDVIKLAFDPVIEAMDEFVIEVHEALVAGNVLIALGYFTGRFVRDFHHGRGDNAKTIPPTGEFVRWHFRDMYHFEEGKIVRIRYANDTLTVARQLGAIPSDGYPW